MYIDLFLILNFFIDLLILITVSYILKRPITINRLLLGSFLGSLSSLIIIFKVSNIVIVIVNILFSILMSLVTFKYKDIKYTFKNVIYIYIVSTILGGALELLNIKNYFILVIIIPIILYIYLIECRSLKTNFNHYYSVDIYIKDNVLKLVGFVDTGNKVIDPISNKSVLLVKDYEIFKNLNYYYIPYNTVNESGLLKCIKPDQVIINKKVKNVVLGIMKSNININGIDCILNERMIL